MPLLSTASPVREGCCGSSFTRSRAVFPHAEAVRADELGQQASAELGGVLAGLVPHEPAHTTEIRREGRATLVHRYEHRGTPELAEQHGEPVAFPLRGVRGPRWAGYGHVRVVVQP
ncbi:hypothetical protein GCM10010345_71970 [Streptomyces canarius]|uniref:Uncharacterized protein n=1 Tax=Streptomyces canarius TaxID=285453 RepID=A0ABQ3D7P6_9ACTN|nr:hypothetical protein GCM10010345_71970 [Streptomyces canarius]